MRTFTNMFLLNLSLMDLLRIIVCLPSAVVQDVTENWYLGTTLCKMVAFIEAFAFFVSELTLSYIAYDRWQSLQNPFKSSNSSSIQKPKRVIILMWILASVLALPVAAPPVSMSVCKICEQILQNHTNNSSNISMGPFPYLTPIVILLDQSIPVMQSYHLCQVGDLNTYDLWTGSCKTYNAPQSKIR